MLYYIPGDEGFWPWVYGPTVCPKGHLEEAGSKLSAHHKHLGLFNVIGVGIICYGHHALILIMLL